MNAVVKKWKPVLDALGVEDEEKLENLAKYADHHAKLETQHNIVEDNIANSTLPVSLKILNKIGDFEVTYDPSSVENIYTSSTFSAETIMQLKQTMGIDVVSMVENVLMEELISKFKNKKVLVYLMVSSIQLIGESNIENKSDFKPMPPTLAVKSQIKIIE